MYPIDVFSLSQNVQKVDDGFYVGQIAGKDLRVVMERVDSSNIQSWLNYAAVQSSSSLVNFISDQRDTNGEPLQKGSLSDGSKHFEQILQTVSYDVNELWVAYITKAKNPEKIPSDMIRYNADDVLNKNHPFAMNVEMFVSVTSSTNALITSHMGVASSLEGVGNRTKGTSVDLHSFAARVMLMRKPERKYMINAPVSTMESIFAQALSGSFHSGTIEMQKKMQKRQPVSLEEFQNDIMPKKELKTNERAKKNPEDPRVVKAEMLRESLSIEEQYHYYRNPYPFKFAKGSKEVSKVFLQFMEKHPPVLSVKNEEMVIFKSNDCAETDIVIDMGHKDYEWLRTKALKPVGSTHYVAVNLLTLAGSRNLDTIN